MTQQTQLNKIEYSQVSELCDFRKGKKVNSTKIKTKNSVPYLLIDTLRGAEPEFFTEDKTYTEAIPEDILIVADGANSGLVGTGVNGAVGSTILRIRLKVKDLDKDYLSYFLKSKFEEFNKDMKGTGIPHLKPKNMLESKIRKPSLPEQTLIVQEIEKQFTKLDAAVESLKTVKQKLEVYRKAVLKKAFEKKKGWEELNFSKCFKSITPTNKIKKSNYLNEGRLPVVDQGEKLIGGYINDENKKQKTPLPVIIFGDHTRRFKFVNFDFVVGADGVKILNIPEHLNPKFAYYQCLTLNFPNKGYSRHFQYVQKTNLIFPKTKEEQIRVVQKIESKFSVIDKIEQVVEASLEKAEKLRKSILKSAFEGKLVKMEEVEE